MKINSIIDLVKDLDTSRQTKNLNKLLIRILLHLQVEFSIDKSKVDYYIQLSQLFSQFRSIGILYNQTVKELHSNFAEKKALALLYKLERYTVELVKTNQQIIALTKQFEASYREEGTISAGK